MGARLFFLRRAAPRRNMKNAFSRYMQATWCAELKLPNSDWQVPASVSRQLKILEQGCPEVCEP